jgi:glycosyltransferase involved in cell wall biosynthesis
MISVVVPVFNAAPYLPELFASLLAQSHAPHEVIFVNDGSSDSSEELISKFIAHAPFPVKYILKENSGSAPSRNRGLAEASGDYIIFLDSDDLLEDNRIESDLAEIAKTKASFVFGPVETFVALPKSSFDRSKHNKNLAAVESGDILRTILLRDVFIVPCMATVSRQLAQEIKGFDESMRYGEDFDFWLRIFSEKPIAYYSNICKAKYRFGHGSKSSHVEKKHSFRMKIYDKFYRSEASQSYLDIKDYAYARVTMSTAADFHRYKKFREFRHYVREAARLSKRSLNFKITKRYILSYLKASK